MQKDKFKVLIPTDFSVQAEYAYLMVNNLEKKVDIDIHFLHILEVPDTVTLSADGAVNTCGDIDVNFVIAQKNIVEHKLQNLKNLYGEHIHTHLQFGKFTDTVTSFAALHKFDIVVMGTKGASGIKDVLSGTKTQMVARKSAVPVLSLMCDRSDLEINNLLLVHDFNEKGADNTNLLQRMIKAFGAKVHMLQIVKSDRNDLHEQILANMDAHAAENGISNYEKHLLRDSDVEQGVIHFNQMKNLDIVCIGTHSKGGLLHKSIAESLIKHLHKPIISFHIN
jgi:nucleotide-binding universal stress UspA family protein